MKEAVKLGFDDLTVAEAREMLNLYASMRGGKVHAYDPPENEGTAHAIERVAQEVYAQTFAPPPPPPVGNSPAPAPVVASQSGYSNSPPPPVGNAPSVPAPAAVPSVPAPAATVTGHPTDNRGVPFHPDHHSGTAENPGINDDGSWKKRRGHDKDALKAYEAPYLKAAAGNSPAGAAPAAAFHPTPGTAPSVTGVSGGANVPPPPPPPPPPAPAPGTPGVQDFEALWTRLVAGGHATPALEQWVMAEYGGHPVHSDVFKLDPNKRLIAYNFLKRYEPQAA